MVEKVRSPGNGNVSWGALWSTISANHLKACGIATPMGGKMDGAHPLSDYGKCQEEP